LLFKVYAKRVVTIFSKKFNKSAFATIGMVEVKKVSKNIWIIEKTGKMNVPILIFASEKLLKKMQEDETFKQAVNISTLPGLVKNVIILPDGHMGYGMPIGGVMACEIENGFISPGSVGFDINCSVRLLRTNLKKEDIDNAGEKKKIIDSLFRDVPSGVGKGSVLKINKEQLKEILEQGIDWAIKNGYGTKVDAEFTEENGRMKEAKADCVSGRAIARGLPQIGSLGSGNHFLEIQVVDEIFDKQVARTFGLEKGQITIMIHCGSRGLGHQVASDYIVAMEKEYGFANLPDRELINAPINSKLGKEYFSAMSAAANFAFANKQIITHQVRETMKRVFPEFKAEVVYDVCHNIAKFEEYEIDGKKKMLCIHRKGATRSFGPGRKEVPKEYREVGQPVLIPGSMGTSSYVLVGTKKAEEVSFASTAHGAGRAESRSQALREMRGEDVKAELKEKGIEVATRSIQGLAEEAPSAYKDIDEVVRVSHEVGIGNLVAKLKPIAVMKG
jgi:tRNA-splicing ligase RtcB